MERDCNEKEVLNSLCDDILYLIFDKYLDLRSVLRTQLVCKRFNQLIKQLFDSKRALILTDKYRQIDNIIDEYSVNYTTLSVQDLCELRDGLWFRTIPERPERSPKGYLKLLTPLEISMFALRKYKHLNALCLVVTNRCSMDSIFDQIVRSCDSKLEKLIVVNINGLKFTINCEQMKRFCNKFCDLKHFEICSDFLYTTEECFQYLMTNCQKLKVFKLKAKQVFKERIESLGPNNGQSINYDGFRFEGFCLTKTSHHLSTIDVSYAVLNSETITSIAFKDRLKDIKHLGVHRLYPESMKQICDNFKNLESLSFSMEDNLNAINTEVLFAYIGRLTRLQTLTISWFGRQFRPYSSQTVKYPDFNEKTIKGLQNCSNLRVLAIKEAIFKDESLKAIARIIPSVESLRLMDCCLNDCTFKPIKSLVNLKELFISKAFPESSLKFLINRFDDELSEQIVLKCNELEIIESQDSQRHPTEVILNSSQENIENIVAFGAIADLEANDYAFHEMDHLLNNELEYVMRNNPNINQFQQ